MNTENLQERLEQCRKDKAAIEVLEKELERQIRENKEPKFGDIVTCPHGLRVVLFDLSKNQLMTFNEHGNSVGSVDCGYYSKTGKNIFKDNLLGLDY